MWLKHIGIPVIFIFAPLILFFMLGQYIPSQHVTFHTTVLGAAVKIWRQGQGRGLQGRGQGLPCAGHRCSSSMDPPQGTAELLSQDAGGASGKVYFRKGKNTKQREKESKRMRNNRGNTNTREGGRGRDAPQHRWCPCCSPHGEPTPEQAVTSWRTGALGGAHIAAGRKWGKKGAAAKKLLSIDSNPPPAPLGRQVVRWGIRSK